MEGAIFDTCKEQNPDFEFTHLAVNHNVTCTPHRDGRNRGEPRILFLGDFEGGDLHFEDGTTFNETKRWLSFDPQMLHWNSPVTQRATSTASWRRISTQSSSAFNPTRRKSTDLQMESLKFTNVNISTRRRIYC